MTDPLPDPTGGRGSPPPPSLDDTMVDATAAAGLQPSPGTADDAAPGHPRAATAVPSDDDTVDGLTAPGSPVQPRADKGKAPLRGNFTPGRGKGGDEAQDDNDGNDDDDDISWDQERSHHQGLDRQLDQLNLDGPSRSALGSKAARPSEDMTSSTGSSQNREQKQQEHTHPTIPGPSTLPMRDERSPPAFRPLQYGDPGWERSADRQPTKLPIRFKDAVGRNFLFPWEKAKTWEVRGELRHFIVHLSSLSFLSCSTPWLSIPRSFLEPNPLHVKNTARTCFKIDYMQANDPG